MASASKQITFSSSSVAMPSWWSSLANLEVTARGNNTLFDVRPSGVALTTIDDVMDSWNGAGYNRTRNELTIGDAGGHTNYTGNEVYTYSVLTDTWTRRTDPSTAAFVGADTEGMRVDGTPMATHTYDQIAMVGDTYYLMGMGSVGGTGNTSSRLWYWDRSNFTQNTGTRGWTTLGLNGLDGSDVGAADYDRITNKVWYAHRTPGGTRSVLNVNHATKAVTELVVSGSTGFGTSGEDMLGVCFDDGSTNSVFMGKGNSVIRTLNLQNPAAWTAPTWTGAVQPSGKCRLHFNKFTNQLITWRQNFNQLVVCDIPSNRLTGTYAWRTVNITGVTISAASTSPQGQNGTFGRFQFIEDMGDGRQGFLIVNEVDQQVYIGKLPATPM